LFNLLKVYCQASGSGQRINKDKSSIFFTKGCPQVIRDAVKNILDINNEALNDRYLGMPTDVGSSMNGTFKFLRDRVWSKVKGWLEKYYRPGERRSSLSQWLKPFQYTQWHVSDYQEVYVSILTR
jgi:hypothetical protein